MNDLILSGAVWKSECGMELHARSHTITVQYDRCSEEQKQFRVSADLAGLLASLRAARFQAEVFLIGVT